MSNKNFVLLIWQIDEKKGEQIADNIHVLRHHHPNIHAEFQNDVAVFSISDGSILEGSFPSSKKKLVEAWIEIHHEELLANWQLAVSGETVFRIKGLE